VKSGDWTAKRGTIRSRLQLSERHLRYLTCLLLMCSGCSCFGQVITVRIVNANNGHALAGQDVSVAFRRQFEKDPAKYDSNLHLQTDSNGDAKFALPQPAPEQLWVGAGLPSENWFCACSTRAYERTQDVVEKGIVGLDPKNKLVLGRRPGQIIFVARPYNLFERLMAPLLRE
jgi:hypothetical protein